MVRPSSETCSETRVCSKSLDAERKNISGVMILWYYCVPPYKVTIQGHCVGTPFGTVNCSLLMFYLINWFRLGSDTIFGRFMCFFVAY